VASRDFWKIATSLTNKTQTVQFIMNEQDSLDRLYEELTLDRRVVRAEAPPYYGITESPYRWWHGGLCKTGSDIRYYNNDNKLHRTYGPAYISKNYNLEIWYLNGEVHRDYREGPAVSHKTIFQWYEHGLRHRLDGPAVIEGAGPKQYWIGGQRLPPKEYKKEIQRRQRRGLIK